MKSGGGRGGGRGGGGARGGGRGGAAGGRGGAAKGGRRPQEDPTQNPFERFANRKAKFEVLNKKTKGQVRNVARYVLLSWRGKGREPSRSEWT